jgi:hypothetical protein
MLRRALCLYRRHLGALVVTGALAIAPASFLEGGARRALLPWLATDGDALPAKSPLPQGAPARLQQFSTPRHEPAHPLQAIAAVLPVLCQLFIGALLLAAGAWLAFAALSNGVFTNDFSSARAWGAAFSRLWPLVGTILLSGAVIAAGALCFLVPGAILAVGLAFTVPAVMEDRLSGSAALHRSWRLVRGTWPEVLLLLLLLAASSAAAWGVSMLAPPGPLRLLIATAVRAVSWPLPLVGLALSYQAARSRA